ncbi:hypothetical protein LZ554_003299 [Drepanopeziza brunnea f. sp. 'monogermtubi']|nr:hypothetical protein LZ554_003299 [Drepanopeziza brunnea f. sp. 'monogermtubi']
MNKLSRDDALEDSTDWLDTPLRSLAAVDSALRCQVCKDFYQTPMITSCMHTFCSLCIRRCLSNDGKCPACRTTDQELKLRNNNAMEDLVEAFKKARPDVLEFARKPATTERSSSPKRSREVAELGYEDETPKKRTRSSRRTAGKKIHATIINDTDEEDGDYVPDQGFVLCPICQKEVKEASINSHIDRGCMDEPRRPVSSSNSKKGPAQNPFSVSDGPGKRPERLAQINFSMMKETALRKKLVDAGINASGNKPLLERRYTEWVTLWNADCDATKPRGKFALKRDLETWERTQGGRAHASNYTQSSGAQIKDKEFDGKAYSSANKDAFTDLIANARKGSVKLPTAEGSSFRDSTPVAPECPVGQTDTEMSERGREESEEITPVKPIGSQQRRFSEESSQTARSSPKPSSQIRSTQKPSSQKSPSQYTASVQPIDA